ncbi:MAG: tRNA 2-thiouridine(34) synthase MnmA [Acidimicrobiales bacterium]|nr:tRNA 2-thiouridine(34) synthase MnmA [Acidimicrobiales bacterium]
MSAPERVLVAMSGGVDSSVAAAVLLEQGHEVVGVTMKLWGGEADQGCCSVADVDDARQVAAHLGIEHHVFNFGDHFDRHVVGPYAADHAAGRTPNPCIECNRHLKFDRLLRRADALGFDALATGHHARIVQRMDGTRRVARGADPAKDQSYVVHVLDQAGLARVRFPVGGLTKADVRAVAAAAGLATADKPDSQDVCFITATGGRAAFLGDRIATRPGTVVDAGGVELGRVAAVELVTLGQRHGLGLPGGGPPRYVVAVDAPGAVVTVGSAEDLLTDRVRLEGLRWVADPVGVPLLAQTSAHGTPRLAHVEGDEVVFAERSRRVAPGQSVVLYEADEVVAAGTAAS